MYFLYLQVTGALEVIQHSSGVQDSKGAVTFLQTAADFDYKSMVLACPFLLSLIFNKIMKLLL